MFVYWFTLSCPVHLGWHNGLSGLQPWLKFIFCDEAAEQRATQRLKSRRYLFIYLFFLKVYSMKEGMWEVKMHFSQDQVGVRMNPPWF